MKIINVIQNTPEWIEARKKVVTGSRLGGLVVKRAGGEKKEFYTLMAEMMGIDTKDPEKPMDRGHRLEEEAIEEFIGVTGKSVERAGLCISDFSEQIGSSPDGLIKDSNGKYTEAVEIKCLSVEGHLEALYENKIPSEHQYQILQYFIVNDDLEKLYFCFYDPRVTKKPFMMFEVNRSEIQADVDFYRTYQIEKIKLIEEFIKTIK